jgi:hypothetical protein
MPWEKTPIVDTIYMEYDAVIPQSRDGEFGKLKVTAPKKIHSLVVEAPTLGSSIYINKVSVYPPNGWVGMYDDSIGIVFNESTYQPIVEDDGRTVTVYNSMEGTDEQATIKIVCRD